MSFPLSRESKEFLIKESYFPSKKHFFKKKSKYKAKKLLPSTTGVFKSLILSLITFPRGSYFSDK